MKTLSGEELKNKAFERRWKELTPIEQKIVAKWYESGDMLQAYAHLGPPGDPIYDVYDVPPGDKIYRLSNNGSTQYAIPRKYKKPYYG